VGATVGATLHLAVPASWRVGASWRVTKLVSLTTLGEPSWAAGELGEGFSEAGEPLPASRRHGMLGHGQADCQARYRIQREIEYDATVNWLPEKVPTARTGMAMPPVH